MAPTLYERLGVPRAATPTEILAAYRRKVLTCHPDRGGLHDEMVAVNEAWEILSNPESRRIYDETLSGTADAATTAAAAAEAAAAKSRAEQYPQTWTEFEAWLDCLGRDFASARYGTTTCDQTTIPIPIVENSQTGRIFQWMFAGTGGILGAAMMLYLVMAVGGAIADVWPVEDSKSNSFLRLLFLNAAKSKPGQRVFGVVAVIPLAIAGVLVGGGLWLGALTGLLLHNAVRTCVVSFQADEGHSPGPDPGGCASGSNSHIPGPQAAGRKMVIRCKECGQKLRVPAAAGRLMVTCGACCHRFDVEIARRAQLPRKGE